VASIVVWAVDSGRDTIEDGALWFGMSPHRRTTGERRLRLTASLTNSLIEKRMTLGISTEVILCLAGMN